MPRKWLIGTVKKTDRVDVALALEDLLEVTLPARRHGAPDHLAYRFVGTRVLRVRLGAPQVAVALEPRRDMPCRRERLGLAVERVRRGPPPGRLDRAAAIRRDDQVDAGLGHSLPELPPRGCAAVAEVEVGRGRDGEDLRRLHRAHCGKGT